MHQSWSIHGAHQSLRVIGARAARSQAELETARAILSGMGKVFSVQVVR
jgi:hypothetical protein